MIRANSSDVVQWVPVFALCTSLSRRNKPNSTLVSGRLELCCRCSFTRGSAENSVGTPSRKWFWVPSFSESRITAVTMGLSFFLSLKNIPLYGTRSAASNSRALAESSSITTESKAGWGTISWNWEGDRKAFKIDAALKALSALSLRNWLESPSLASGGTTVKMQW